MPLHSDHRDQGFTLAEVLVVLALTAILTMLAFEGLGFGARAWERGTSHGETMVRHLQGQDKLQRLIEQAYPLKGQDGRIAFSGTSDEIVFLSPDARAGGHARMTLKIENKRLVLIRSPYWAEASNGANSRNFPLHTEVLLTNAEGLRVSYFGAPIPGDAPSWRSSWPPSQTLPILVNLRIDPIEPDDGWPTVMIRLRVEENARCTFDVTTRTCRET